MLKVMRSKWTMEYEEDSLEICYMGEEYDVSIIGEFETMQEVNAVVSDMLKEDVRVMLLNIFDEPGTYRIVTKNIEEEKIDYGTEEIVAYIEIDNQYLGYHVVRVEEDES